MDTLQHKKYSTWDSLDVYVLLNSLEEVNKNQLFISCTVFSAGRESEASQSQVQNKPRILSKAPVQLSSKLM